MGKYLTTTATCSIALLLSLLLGCAVVPAHEGTALDHIQDDLDDAIATNKNLKPALKLPTAVTNSLTPKFTITKNNRKNLMQPEDKFNVIADAVPASAFFLSLVEGTDINLALHPKVQGSISVKLKNVNVMDVLDVISRVYGYGIEVENNNIRILPAELQTKTFKVNYLDITRNGSSETKVSSSGLDAAKNSGAGSSGSSSAGGTSSSASSGGTGGSATASSVNSKVNTTSNAHFWVKLEETLKIIVGSEDGRKVAVIPITGMVVVQAMPDELKKIERFLKQSELFLNRQVILETKILEVELNDAYRAGINWSILSRHLNTAQLGGGVDPTIGLGTALPNGNGTRNATLPLSLDGSEHTAPTIANSATPFGGIFTLGLNYNRLSTFVEMLGAQGNVQVLSSPRISTTNNQKALIKVGSDAFFVTDVTSTTSTAANGSTTSSPTVKFDSFFSGIALDVTPQIEEDGHVTLHVHPTISTVSKNNQEITVGGKIDNYPLASSTVRESDSIIRAKNGQFVIIGGLMQDKTGEVVTGVPMLKDIPFFGSAFRQTKQEARKTELVILLRPLVMDDNEWQNQLEESHDRFNDLDQGFHVGGNACRFGTMAEIKR